MDKEKLVQWFWGKVDVKNPDQCWEWTGRLDDKGYGASRTLYDHGYPQRASRSAYIFSNGPIESGLVIRHTCHNRKCCNPLHLIKGTQKDNMQDRKLLGNYPRGEKHFNSFISDDQRRAIYLDPRSHREIAKDYGLKSHATVGNIKRSNRWRPENA